MPRALLWPAVGGTVILVLTALVLAVSAATLQPPTPELLELGAFLLVSGGTTVLMGYGGATVGQGRALRTFRSKLLFLLLLAVALALVNVAFTAQLMFISAHDLGLLGLLLAFSLGMSVFLAFLLARPLDSGVKMLVRAAHSIGEGNLDHRVVVTGSDELEVLASALNGMAAQLEGAAAQQRDLESARRDLVAAVSHDLRTPLASMRAMIESINDGVVSDFATVQRYLRTLQAEVEHMSVLISDLFELSQLDAGLLQLHVEQASIQDLISDTLQSVSAQADQKGLRLSGQVDKALPPIGIDAGRVHRALQNLVQNALRHTPTDGAIVIRAEDAGQEIRVSVADTGDGIAPDDLPRILGDFYRRDDVRSRGTDGTGLGLSIAKGIVEAHGGRLWAESTPGAGATFIFSLPKGVAPAAAPAGT